MTGPASILIVKLSSLGDVVHAIPVVHDIRQAHPQARIDWVVEPAFAPLLRRVAGIGEVVECPLRRWSRQWWRPAVRTEWRSFRERLRRDRYDAVLDLQGLTKSALIARTASLTPLGATYGLANRTEGASHELPARWLVDRAIRVEPHIHALDRSRVLAAAALGHAVLGPPRFDLRVRPAAVGRAPTLVLVHGSSRDDKLWLETSWIELAQRAAAQGWRIALPQAGAAEHDRAQRIAAALGGAAEVWPAMDLDALVDRLGATQGVIGVDSGPSHLAVALDLPHVQIYNWPTAWRTGPQVAHGHRHQVSVDAGPTAAGIETAWSAPLPPSVDAVWDAWRRVGEAGA